MAASQHCAVVMKRYDLNQFRSARISVSTDNHRDHDDTAAPTCHSHPECALAVSMHT
jgi:hypothetical protein